MLMLINMLTHPMRSVRMLIVTTITAGVLLLALANADPAMQSLLAGILGLLVMAVVLIRVPMRIAGRLMLVAIVVVGAISLVREVIASGYLPLAVVGVVVAVPLWMSRGVLGRVVHRPPPSRGARWATLRDLRRAGFLAAHGWPLGSVNGGHIVRLPMEREREGILATAATGAGKTSILVLPALIEEANRPAGERRSLVVVDPKDELTRDTMPTLARTHRVQVWDPSKPEDCTVGFDPLASLPGPNDESFVGECKALAQSWFWATREGEKTSDPFWITQPRSLMESLFIAFVVTNPAGTFVDLAVWVRSLTIGAFQSMLDQSTNEAVRASAEMLRAAGMSDKSMGSIWSDVLQRFDSLDDPRVRRSMTGPAWSVTGPEPTVLYLRVGAQDAQRLAPLLSLAIGQIYRELTKAAARQPRNRLAREARLICDEFGTLPRIYGIETALATLRSYGVGHYMLIQTSAQLVHHYGRELAQTIEDNLVTKVVLGGAADGDAKAFSARCGEVTEYHEARSWNGRSSLFAAGSISHSPERRPLVSAAEIIHMRDTVLVSTRGIAPFRTTAQPYFTNPATMQRLAADQRAFAQHAAPQTAPSPAPASPPPDRGNRDIAPPGCSDQEWNAAAPSLRIALWSAEDDLLNLVTGRVADLDQIRQQWQTNPARSTLARYAKITAEERAKTPAVAAYVDELALRLELRHEDEPTA